ncbi:ubiquinol-cytochrome c reductase iron-sulfur subunit [Luedemannella flava]|uniref:Cytochrome bc1 complex Rieske iron-sulfur subunit n=1 Tax=Luedemannella flava TaxID=349316 RepID=A0ABN2MJ87_9ACTN
MSGHQIEGQEPFDVDDPALTRFDLVREGARRDGVEIVHYKPRFPVPGTKVERRIERSIALMLTLAGVFAVAFVILYIWWPWEYEGGSNAGKWYTPLLGLTLGGSLVFLALAIITWGKKLLPEEISVQERHDGPSAHDEQQLTGATIVNMGDELGIARRPLLKAAVLLPGLGLGAAAVAPLVGGLIKSPHEPDAIFFETGWNPKHNDGHPVRLVREDGTPIRPEDVSTGGQMTVFPGIPGGASNKWADSPTLLIHLRPEDSALAYKNANNSERPPGINGGSQWGDFVAYSKICTHAGCPASLYEQQTNRLLCPCHQSQFDITDNARPVFGPASRSLPQLPLDVDAEGYFVATGDYKVAVGPAFWERP